MINIIYWSGTGTTEKMAYSVLSGIEKAGGEGRVIDVFETTEGIIENGSAFAFGCPPMGEECLEKEEFEPFFSLIEEKLLGKAIGLFGSYGWGGGRWMDDWKKRCIDKGAILVCEPVICCDEPDTQAFEKLEEMGRILCENTFGDL